MSESPYAIRHGVAAHEAAHATVARRVGASVVGVTVSDRSGACWNLPPIDPIDQAAVAVAGEVGARRAGRMTSAKMSAADNSVLAKAFESYRRDGGLEDLAAFTDRAKNHAEQIIRNNWGAILKLAEVLAGHDILTGAEAERIIGEPGPIPKIVFIV